MASGTGSKQARMEAVAEHIARIVLAHGLDAVTHARVARTSGVSRPWLYKYVGRERAELVRFMAQHFGMRLAELDRRPRTDTRKAWVQDTVDGLRTMAQLAGAAPWVLPLYYRYIGSDGPIGRCIADIEARYLDASALELTRAGIAAPERARYTAELLHATRMGIVHRHLITGLQRDRELQVTAQAFRGWLDSL